MQHQRWTEGKDNGSINPFKQGYYRKGLQEILKSSVAFEANGDFFEWI